MSLQYYFVFFHRDAFCLQPVLWPRGTFQENELTWEHHHIHKGKEIEKEQKSGWRKRHTEGTAGLELRGQPRSLIVNNFPRVRSCLHLGDRLVRIICGLVSTTEETVSSSICLRSFLPTPKWPKWSMTAPWNSTNYLWRLWRLGTILWHVHGFSTDV